MGKGLRSAHTVDAAAPCADRTDTTMPPIHFASAADGSSIATITDDLEVRINARPTVTVDGCDGAVTLDFDDTVDVIAALTAALTILQNRGAGTAYPNGDSGS